MTAQQSGIKYGRICCYCPIDAYQQYLLNPLSITRIHRAQDLIVNQHRAEARYQDPNLSLARSVWSDSQPLVPQQYGSQEISIDDGGGGLSGAATDMARLIAILISENHNPALKRSTLDSMLSAGSALTAKGMGRAGYGFDQLIKGPGNPPPAGIASFFSIHARSSSLNAFFCDSDKLFQTNSSLSSAWLRAEEAVFGC